MIYKTISIALAAGLLAACGATSNDTQGDSEMTHAGPTMNFHRIDPQLATGGHFVGDGLDELKAQGVTVVIDLRDKPPEDQAQRLADAGIRWINVPVVWKEPKLEDFAEFSRVMAEVEGENVLVQCQGNYRASAMTYAYRVTQGGVPEAEARRDLEAIWAPEGTWEAYVGEILESGGDWGA